MDEDAAMEARIEGAWRANAAPWVRVVRQGQIESRRHATDAAVVGAVLDASPAVVLDVGCGEGWLARTLAQHGVRVVGIDAVPDLVEEARMAGGGEFHAMDYGRLAAGDLDIAADVVVCNFSLLGKEATEHVFRAAGRLLGPSGRFVVQTLHPVAATGASPYADGWREGSWRGVGEGFAEPAPWYFRTLGSWLRLFTESGFRVVDLLEPTSPGTGQPVSALFVAVPNVR